MTTLGAPAICFSAWIAAVVAGLLLSVAVAAQEPLVVGALYRTGDAGERYRRGIEQAIERLTSEESPILLRGYEYADEDAGLERLEQIFEGQEVHLVLGPTDSGVFEQVAEQREKVQRARIPVISPIVTVPFDNRKDGWLFRTNVDVDRRAQRIFKHLEDSGFQRIAVFYADSGFGRAAETAFRRVVERDPDVVYLQFRYHEAPNILPARRRLLEERPGAVGVFGLRPEVASVWSELQQLRPGWNGYDPLLFSLVDQRRLELPDLAFASLSGTGALASQDEVEDLAYDTTLLALHVAEGVEVPLYRDGGSMPSEGWREEFRRRFGARVADSELIRGSRTNMRFGLGRNLATPEVLEVSDDSVAAMATRRDPSALLARVYGLDRGMASWIDVRQRRFGSAPLVCLVLLMTIAGVLSFLDLRRWQGGRSRTVTGLPFFGLLIFNIGTAVLLFVFLAETGYLAWNSLGGAVLVGLGHAALLKTTVFETPTGQAWGLGQYYDRVVGWLNKQIMNAKWEREGGRVNFVAYTNSINRMRETLGSLYGFARTADETMSLTDELEDRLRGKSSREQRIVLAKELLMSLSWRQLVRRKLVPAHIPRRRLIDPERIVRTCADYLLNLGEEGEHRLARRIEEERNRIARITGASPPEPLDGDPVEEEENGSMLAAPPDEEKAELDSAQTSLGRIEVRVRWLFMQYGYRLERIHREGLAPDGLRDTLIRELHSPLHPANLWLDVRGVGAAAKKRVAGA